MGQVGDAFSNKNTFAPDPQGFSGSEWTARLLGGAGKGALQGFSNMQRPQQGGSAPVQPQSQAPIVQNQIYDPNASQLGSSKYARNPMFYGYGQ